VATLNEVITMPIDIPALSATAPASAAARWPVSYLLWSTDMGRSVPGGPSHYLPDEDGSGKDSPHLSRGQVLDDAKEKSGMKVGDVARRSRKVTMHDIELFTEMTGDRNPLHYDQELARRTRFGGIVVQGGVTTGLLNAVVAEDLPGPGSVFLNLTLDFHAPVRPGDEITAEVEVLEVREDKPITKLAATITRQDGVKVVSGTAVTYREPLK
jgi:acyl dehydratase